MCVTFNLISWNVNGAKKLRSFLGHSKRGLGSPDVLFLQETWISSEAEQLVIDGYVAFHAPAVPTHGHDSGGLSSFFKLTTFAGGQLEKKDTPVPWVSTVRWSDTSGESGVLFVNVYSAVHTTGVLEQDFELVAEYLTELRASFGNDQIVIAGDFNADRWRRPVPANNKERLSLQILNDLEEEGFQIRPERDDVTYVDSSTTIDYAIVSPGTLIQNFSVLPVGLCQHLPLSITLTVSIDIPSTSLPLRSPNLVFVPNRVNRTRELLRLCSSQFSSVRTVDDCYDTIEAVFLNCGVEKQRVSQSYRAGSWWRYVPRELRTEVDGLENETTEKVRSWIANEPGAPSTEDLITLRRKLSEVSMRAYKLADVALQEEMAKGFVDASLCWRILKKIRNPVASVAIDVGTLEEHFAKVFHRRDRPVIHLPDPVLGWGTTISGESAYDLPFTDKELVEALKELNGAAATGPERIPSRTIKDVFSDMDARAPLLSLMNLCWETGTVPRAWGENELFILYKGKGLRTLADNYRAIALSNDFRRVFERLVGKRLSRWSLSHDATGKMQFGFRSGVSTLEAIFVVRSFMFHATRTLSRPGYAMFIDIRKAFPSMGRPKIVKSLCELRVPKKVTRSIASLMNGTTSRLRVNGRLTKPILVTSGTPEGSINSPDLFNLVYRVILDKLGIEELPEDLSLIDPAKVYFVVFADDLTFLSLNLRALEGTAAAFKVEALEYDLAMNEGKSKWMVFLPPQPETSAPPDHPLSVMVDGVEIENVDSFVYLGFELDNMLDDSLHTKRVNDRLLKAARATGQIMREMKCSNPISLRKYFLSLVASQLYGALFLDCGALEWEKAVGVFVRTALALPSSFPTIVCVALLGLWSLRVKVVKERMKFLLKVEAKPGTPSFAALVYDRCILMPRQVGVNARLGDTLVELDILRTIDYREHFSQIVQAFEREDEMRRRTSLLGADGRAFWTEISSDGWLPCDLALILKELPYEQVRIFLLFLADSLKWSAVCAHGPCSTCHAPFSSMHFFCCPRIFLSGREWSVFVALCQAGAWQDVVEVTFAILKRWVTETQLFRPTFKLNVLEFEPAMDPNPFRLSIF
jgi:exonuclease III